MPRRLVPLVVLFAAASWGCGVFAGASPTATPTPTVTRTPTVTSTPTPPPTPTPQPRLETAALEIAQGGAGVLRVSGSAASGVAVFEGREYALLPGGAGFWGVIGLGADHAPGSYPVAVILRDAAGAPLAELTGTVIVIDSAFPVEQITIPPDQSPLLGPDVAAQEAAIRNEVYSRFTPERLWAGPFIYPVAGRISSPYGSGRSYNGAPVSSYHRGTDFAPPEGTPVAASNSGRVAFAGALPIRGTSVIIDHGAGVFSGYHHLSGAAVVEGQVVAAGDLVGYVGGTGLATGPHLHWEIVVAGVEVDPVRWTQADYGP